VTPAAEYDVVNIGGGPAGSSAALTARARGLSTLIIEASARPEPGVCTGWLGPAAQRCCSAYGVTARDVGGAEFTGLRLRSWDFAHCVDVHDPELTGWVVEPTALSGALFDAAGRAGTTQITAATIDELEIGERLVRVRLKDAAQPAGRVLLIADGATSAASARAQLRPLHAIQQRGGCAFAVADVADAGVGVEVVIAGGRTLKLVSIVRNHTQVRVGLLTRDAATPAAQQLDAFLAAASAADVLPAAAWRARPAPDLAGVALEVESHVSKRCIIIGDAGGFAASFSNEGAYPALRSGGLAAETVARALAAPVLQDELATYGATWRAELADYMRMPNTDLGLLMPMVFNNPQMSRRVARAFLLGQAF
jgi:flavin-dependent dehydrogenase